MSLEVRSTLEAVLGGNRRALARAITQVENETSQAHDILNALYPHTGGAMIVGITGAPGTGKSTLVNALAKYMRGQGKTVGIVAVDPSSPFSHGAVLGDRIRMRDLAGDEGVFIRSMATRGSLGGLARTTMDVVRVLDAAGFDIILLETVGAGQSEVAIASAAQTTLVVDAPGLGDDIQATKAGILEIADILIVNKADHPGANKTVQALKAMLDLGHRMQMVAHHGRTLLQDDGSADEHDIDTWQIPVLKTTATNGEGIPEVYDAMLRHADHLAQSGLGSEREIARLDAEIAARLQDALLQEFIVHTTPGEFEDLLNRLAERKIAPAEAVRELMKPRDRL